MADPLKIVVLISGGGTTLKNLIERKCAGLLHADIVGVISSNRRAAGNEFAVQESIPLTVIENTADGTDTGFSEAIFGQCRDWQAELVVMAGFLKYVSIPQDFENRVINIHPSLIPAFSGKGFYGGKVHAAVMEYGCKLSGCTVHFVDNQYDHGPIIAQRVVAIAADDNAETLQRKVFAVECELYPEVINRIAGKAVVVTDRTVSFT